MNIIEQQTASTIMRLLQSNKFFHENKEGTIERNAEKYIIELCKTMNMDPDEKSYNDLRQRLANRHTQGIDLISLTLKNPNIHKIAQWQSHKNLKTV